LTIPIRNIKSQAMSTFYDLVKMITNHLILTSTNENEKRDYSFAPRHHMGVFR
jgi:hypothetical protein